MSYLVIAEMILAILIIIAPLSMLAVIIVNGILEYLECMNQKK